MYNKLAIGFVIMAGIVAGVYFIYFHKPPAKDILAANRKLHSTSYNRNVKRVYEHHSSKKSKDSDDDEDDYYYEEENDTGTGGNNGDKLDINTPEGSRRLWDHWVEEHNYVSIGELYNKCEGEDRIMYGRGILMEDKSGGLKTRTYVNFTMTKELSDGQFYILSKYNGKELYSNHWDVCKIDEDKPDRLVFCPMSGKKNFVKDMKIPSYLPKGHFETKIRILNQDDEEILCSFSAFDL